MSRRNRSNPEQDDSEQSKRFLEAARTAGADDSKDAADRAFKKAVGKPLKKKD